MSTQSLVVMYRDDDQEHEITVRTTKNYPTWELFTKAESIITDLINHGG